MLIENEYPEPQFNFVSPDNRTWWQKFVRRFYYHPRVLQLPENPGFDLGNGSVIRVRIGSTFNFWERIAFLFSGSVKVEALIVTENSAGRTYSDAQSYVCLKDDLKGLIYDSSYTTEPTPASEESSSSVD